MTLQPTWFLDDDFNLTDIDNITVITNFTDDLTTSPPPLQVIHQSTIVILSTLFFIIGIIGIVGNSLVIFVITSDKQMRKSMINLLIMNLAVSDLIIMVVCIPDIIQFMRNAGWRLGLTLCCLLRFTEVLSLYASVMTLVTICVERYIAITHPMHANVICYPRRIHIVIGVIWPSAMGLASPNLLFNFIDHSNPQFTPCYPNHPNELIFKYIEFTLFYLIPLVIQIVLYVKIGVCLFRKSALSDKDAEKTRARRGVVKMLIAGVVAYFVCFSPHQVLLFYNTFVSPLDFNQMWGVLVFVNIMAYMSSACNPLLYSIFSVKFRQKFKFLLSCSTGKINSGISEAVSIRFRSFKSSQTEV